MIAEEDKEKNTAEASPENSTGTALAVNTKSLDLEALEIINKVIEEKEPDKVNDLTQLFNINQKKKTMARMNKLNELEDVLVDQAISRFTKKPDEIDNNTLIQGLKTVQDIVEKNNKMINEQPQQPLIQINQQEVNINDDGRSRESRDRIKNAVASILASAGIKAQQPAEEEVIDADVVETATEESDKND